MPDETDTPRLIVLPPSHYCERARWALDHLGMDYREERWAVGLHVPLARRIATGTTLPILAIGEKIIQGSDRILDWTALDGGAPAIEQRFEKRVGPMVRQYLYAATLSRRKPDIRDVLFDGVPKWQDRAARLMWPITRRLMIQGLDARPALVPALETQISAELDWFDGELAGRNHLVGDRLGRADITACSLLAPLARPVERPVYRRAALPDRIEDALAAWGGRASLRWVLDTYARSRSQRRDAPGPDGL